MKPYLLIRFTLLLSIFTATHSFGQSWLWAKRFEFVVSEKADRLDNLIRIGYSNTHSQGTFQNYIAKFDRFGNQIWKKSMVTQSYNFGGLFSGVLSQAFDFDGNIYLLTTNVKQYGDSIFIINDTAHNLIKLDPNGNLIWRKKLTSQEFKGESHITSNGKYDLFLSFQTMASNYQLLDSIYIHPAPGNTLRLFTAKIDTSGKVKWTRIIYGNKNYQYFIPPGTIVNALNLAYNQVSANESGYVLIGGVFYDTLNAFGSLLTATAIPSLPQVKKSAFLVLLDSNGQHQWTRLIPLAHERNLINAVHLFPNKYGAYQLRNLFENIPLSPTTFALVYNDTLVFTNSQGSKITQVDLRPTTSDHFETNAMIGKGYSIFMTGRQFITPIVNPYNDTTYMLLRRYDTSGTLQWNKGLPPVQQFKSSIGKYISPASDFLFTSGGISTAADGQCIFDNDTLNTYAALSTTSFLAALRDSVNFVSGRVFIDANNNGVYNAGIDMPAAFQLVGTTTSTARAITDTSGYYRLFVGTGAVTVSPLPVPNYYTSLPVSHNFNFSNYGNNAPDENFIYVPSTTANDLEITITPLSGASWVRPSYLQLSYKNAGTTTLSGTVRLKLDPRSFYISSSIVPSFTSTDSLTWDFTNLLPLESRSINVTHRYQPQPGRIPVTIKAWVDPITGDATPQTNSDTAHLIATGPYDPNDKLANPIDQLHRDSVMQNKAMIDYIIRFQNTGSDTAFQVKVSDTLSSFLNTGSLQIIATSHYCLATIKNNLLEFYFPNISLPDSNVNESASHGFVHYRIKANTSLGLSDTIYNSAAIYFDYNPAIITNRTKNYIANPIITGISDPGVSKFLGIWPNPATATVFYELKNASVGKYMVRVFDLNGKLMSSANALSNGTSVKGNISVSSLAKGVYVLEVSGRSTIGRTKLLRM